MTTLAPPPATGRDSGPRHRAEAPSTGVTGVGGGPAARVRRMFTGAPEDPRWAHPALWAILVPATALYAWNLSSITGNTFYNAAVYSGTKSWKAFFFGALDSGSFITVDKPPFALWVMGLSARVFGYGTWQMMLPMVAVGVGSVALLYRMVKRDFGAVAGTIAALALTLTPITVAITRDTNPDPILVFLMLLGAAALMKAVRTGRAMPLVWSGVAIGFAFNTKMMQAYVLQRVSGSGTLYTVAQVVAGVAGAVAVIGLLVGRFMRRRKLVGLASIAAVVALLAGPAAYSVSAATTASANGTSPTAGPNTGSGMGGGGGTGGGMGGGSQVSSEMITYLKKNQDGATWLVAVATDQTASSIILESGQPVISMGGWSGGDEAMTLAKLKELVKAGKLHYIVVSDSDSGRGGSSTAASEIAEWVKANGSAVNDYSDSGLYRLDASDVS
ncbi:phospholipid carrier-dependent glycosyltransferase [Streptomyces phaeolivaceus]|uniref:Phospholipid carrier-dependent glycosyltransferase n=1 Tax=Streptomyces phaeolivaceus TaxID=2653200 RepID=A0A5P8K5U2_9ACTN|nr:glycosyltransferase family 39 protein [Streptomyces phaeolivaceus]QFQ98162.1 phospholipid carrier-dependent glycosyltransferase [Streptomyces phaeolivaceus]